MEGLLKTSAFKEFSIEKHFKEHITDPVEQNNFTTQLELAILGLLWCTDTQEAKAQFLHKVINPQNLPEIAWNDKELKTVITKLFYYSNDLIQNNDASEPNGINEDQVKKLIDRQ